MKTRRPMLIAVVVLSLAASTLATPGLAQRKTCGEIKTLDPDNDGTMDLTEAKAAASRLFDKIDADKDGTLSQKELRGRMTAKELQAADTDKDGTIDKAEFLTEVDKRFKVADSDGDGTIDCKELKGTAGKALVKLLK